VRIFAFDLGSRSTTPIATDWHDGQIICAFVPFPPHVSAFPAVGHVLGREPINMP
jgi:hypothetical protein